MWCVRGCARVMTGGTPQETTDPPGDFAGDGLSRKTNNTDVVKRIIQMGGSFSQNE